VCHLRTSTRAINRPSKSAKSRCKRIDCSKINPGNFEKNQNKLLHLSEISDKLDFKIDKKLSSIILEQKSRNDSSTEPVAESDNNEDVI
jgi:hypothetical protein